MPVTISASLVASRSPSPVQVALSGVPAGTAYTVTGSALGSSWTVPGGSGVSVGSQVLLVDNRSAINVPVIYSATVAGATYTAAPVTVSLPGARVVIQSLDGRESVVLADLRANGLPRSYGVRSHESDVPGRQRPPARFAAGSAGGGSLLLRTDRAGSAVMESLLAAGRPVVLRTDGGVRDLPAVDLLRVTAASSVLWDAYDGATGRLSDGRVWSITYALADDPEPSRVLGVFTWADFDAAMAGRTWAGFDAIFAGRTWADFDTQDWGLL